MSSVLLSLPAHMCSQRSVSLLCSCASVPVPSLFCVLVFAGLLRLCVRPCVSCHPVFPGLSSIFVTLPIKIVRAVFWWRQQTNLFNPCIVWSRHQIMCFLEEGFTLHFCYLNMIQYVDSLSFSSFLLLKGKHTCNIGMGSLMTLSCGELCVKV